MKIKLKLLTPALVVLMASATGAGPKICTYTVGDTGCLIINQSRVIRLGGSYRGLNAKQRIDLLESRLRKILQKGYLQADKLRVVEKRDRVGLSYAGQWLVSADPVTAKRYRCKSSRLARIWRDNLLDILGGRNARYQVVAVLHGRASWYGNEFQGRRTANGDLFNQTLLTAAHRSLEFGTKVRVTNLQTQQEVIVTINDRGPWIKGREIDLSRAAARIIGIRGVGSVKIEVLREIK